MKELLSFVKWQWQQWKVWQRVYITAMTCFLIGVFLPGPYNLYVTILPIAVLLVMVAKWGVWDMLQASWCRYKSEKRKLFDVIKGD